MSKKTRRNIQISLFLAKGIFKFLYYAFTITILMWIGVSILEVWFNNWNMTSESPATYSSLNMFKILFKA